MFFVAENNPEQKDYQLFILDRRIPNDKSNMAADTYQLLSSKGVVRGPTYSPFPTLSSLRDKLKQGQAKAAK